ncbi:hypothetical protein CWB75_10860 [Pseudoalteromonas sp. S1608]|nr:hypothetical protein CWB75_10860 [Pseudoalteromonas sp. S1608]
MFVRYLLGPNKKINIIITNVINTISASPDIVRITITTTVNVNKNITFKINLIVAEKKLKIS